MHPTIDNVLRPLNRFIATPGVWAILNRTVIRFARGLQQRRRAVVIERLSRQLAANGKVESGPFAGMHYAKPEATCSAILPKLLGTYEHEIAHTIEQLCGNRYDIVIDIGCAEGYYAVGLALRFATTPVVAFDIDPLARQLCEANARLNAVSDRLEVLSEATATQITRYCGGRRALIVCDCEGFEEDLLMPIAPETLSSCDILVETHDFIRENIHDRLMRHFSQTHSSREFHSIDDRQKARTYKSTWTAGMDDDVLESVYAECRPVIMRWLLLQPLNSIR